MAEFHTATIAEYRCLHPDNDTIPPLVTEDGDVNAVGTAHGRTIPVIGSTRPPIYDISMHPFDGGNVRVYADNPDDVLAVICGQDYQRQLTVCRDIIAEYNMLVDEDTAGEHRAELRADFDAESTFLCLIRGVLAHTARALAQAKINEQAKQSGSWEQLSDEEKDILTRAADTNSEVAPVGVVREMVIPNPLTAGETFTGRRGTWTADVPLVLNEADYYPWSPVPLPYSSVLVTGADGQEYQDDVSTLNLRVLRVANADDFLADMAGMGVIDRTIRPVVPVDPIYRDGYDDAVNARIEANTAALAAS